MIYHEGTKGTKDTKPNPASHNNILSVRGRASCSFVLFVSSW